uniref:Putative secreted protein n=1 Tax=Anopheles triannulatus TaxID=58253 RepID=A0A2M4B1E8_9DIPT
MVLWWRAVIVGRPRVHGCAACVLAFIKRESTARVLGYKVAWPCFVSFHFCCSNSSRSSSSRSKRLILDVSCCCCCLCCCRTCSTNSCMFS